MSPSLTRTVVGAVVFLVLAILATLCHLSRTFAWQMLGSTLGLIALALAVGFIARTYPFFRGTVPRRQGPPRNLAQSARRILPPLCVIFAAVAVLAPLLRGQMPLSHDHPVHLYKAWHFWDEMLLSGRLRGWSSFWFFGYPAEELYPIGPDIWVALFRVVTLGLFSWETTYGLAFVGVFAFAAYAMYSFGKRYFSAGAGVVAGMLWIFDRGDYREGGWSYTVDWAVWVQILAMAFALLVLGRLQPLLERGKPRDYAICGLLFAAALLSHQMNMIVFGVSLPLLLLARWLTARQPHAFGREVARVAAVSLIGAAVAGFWLLPMLARSGSWTTSIGDLWRPLSQTAAGLLDGSVFANVWPLPVMLGLLGAGLGLATRRPVPIFLTLFAAVLLLASSSTAFNELSLMAVSKAFSKIQYQRLIIPAKAALFLLAGFAVSELWTRVKAWREQPVEPDGRGPSDKRPETAASDSADDGPGAPVKELEPAEDGDPPTGLLTRWAPRARRIGLVVLAALVLGPFVRPAIDQLQQRYLRTIGGLVLKRSIPYWEDYRRFLEWSVQRRANSSTFYRISYELDRHNHLMMGAPVHNRTPYYKVGYTPAKLFKHVTETTEDPLYRALSVAYVVSLHPLSRPGLKLETNFGSIWVYRFTGYRPERYTLTGPGKVKVLEFSEERIRLELSGTGAGSRLKVHVANYPRWRARQGGKTLQINDAPVYGTTYPMLMEVKVGDGELVFDYVVRGVDALGSLLFVVGIGVVALLALVERYPALATWLRGKVGWIGPPTVRYAGWATLVLALLIVALVTHRVARGSSGLSEGSVANMLGSARVTAAGRPCTRHGDRWSCSSRSWNYVGPTTSMFNGALLPCIWAHPVDEGPLQIHIPRVRIGRALVGNHGLADGAVDGFPGGAAVSLQVRINGQTIQTLTRPNQKGWVGFRVDTSRFAGQEAELGLEVSTVRSGGRHYCFDMRIER